MHPAILAPLYFILLPRCRLHLASLSSSFSLIAGRDEELCASIGRGLSRWPRLRSYGLHENILRYKPSCFQDALSPSLSAYHLPVEFSQLISFLLPLFLCSRLCVSSSSVIHTVLRKCPQVIYPYPPPSPSVPPSLLPYPPLFKYIIPVTGQACPNGFKFDSLMISQVLACRNAGEQI
jgi:hypothetical protein